MAQSGHRFGRLWSVRGGPHKLGCFVAKNGTSVMPKKQMLEQSLTTALILAALLDIDHPISQKRF